MADLLIRIRIYSTLAPKAWDFVDNNGNLGSVTINADVVNGLGAIEIKANVPTSTFINATIKEIIAASNFGAELNNIEVYWDNNTTALFSQNLRSLYSHTFSFTTPTSSSPQIPTTPPPIFGSVTPIITAYSTSGQKIKASIAYTLTQPYYLNSNAIVFRQIKDSGNFVVDLQQQTVILQTNGTATFLDTVVLPEGNYTIEGYVWINGSAASNVVKQNVTISTVTQPPPPPTTNDAIITISQYNIVGANTREILIVSNKTVDNSWIVEFNNSILINGNGLNSLSTGYGFQVGLQQGTNTIRVKNITGGLQSAWSNTLTQTYSTDPPPTAILSKRVVIQTKCGGYTTFMEQSDYDTWVSANNSSTLGSLMSTFAVQNGLPENPSFPNSLTYTTLEDVTFTPNTTEQLTKVWNCYLQVPPPTTIQNDNLTKLIKALGVFSLITGR